jgi:broad specificity phosphatase PhoE
VIELWLIRHGETEWSAAGRHTGRTDIPLTKHGREMAARVGEFLAGTEFAAVLRSPLLRAKETCEIAGFGDVAVADDGLCEWDYGVYEGKTSKEIQAEIPGWSVWKDAIVGGETCEQVGARADEVITRAVALAGDVAENTGAVRVAMFAHAHIFRILAARWVGLAARQGSLFALSTASVSVLGMERETRVVQRWNRTFEG